MPSSEKANLQAHFNRQSQAEAPSSTPGDLPPAYENTVVSTNTSNSHPTSPSHLRARTRPRPNSAPINTPSQNPLKTLSRLSSLNLSSYGVRDAKLSDDHTTLTTSRDELATTQYALAKFIHDQAALPPKPVMVIRGTHASYGTHGGTAVDFELKLNLMGMLDLESDGPDFDGTGRSRLRVKAFPHQQQQAGSSSSSSQQGLGSTPTPTTTTTTATSSSSLSSSPLFKRSSSTNPNLNPLDCWIQKFTSHSSTKADNRSFTLTRVTLNMPRAILEGHVRTLIAATKYRGKVTVEFPVLHSTVTVERHNGNWFTNLLNITPTKTFDVVQSVWSIGGEPGQRETGDGELVEFAESDERGGERDDTADRNARAGLVAQEWWSEWQGAIWNAVLAGRHGWITVEDWLEASMGVRQKDKGKEWGVDYQG
ncbi:uncharacterized protein A1O9_04750 [Exophiala aquamarina CBS 119918]|uniref:Uncharacterized protein n=1 Tax=Exophiala aquamarina CBS 119918 TaxID=1182545 RepID=A0A072PJI5_9EURO|nr:uncharacterized protein A1O9_04750 [Exophiala aquamarina CBS 119918]KEF59902.1 hypothetical protein A1O9_04750 [Exophiala aquamarina CBS 119918]